MSDPDALNKLPEMLGDPEVLLGAIQSPTQREMLPQLEAIVAVVVGYVDHVMDTIGPGLVGSYGMVTEALRRRRVTADPSDRFVERLFGLELTQSHYERGTAFVDGVVERAGADALERLWRVRSRAADAGRDRRSRAVAGPHRPARELTSLRRSRPPPTAGVTSRGEAVLSATPSGRRRRRSPR